MDKRVAVTGLGVLSCIGNDVKTFWQNLKDGFCGIDYITEFPTDGFPVKIGGKIRDFNPEDFGMPAPFIRKQAAFTVYAMASAIQAMQDSGLWSGENIAPEDIGTIISSGVGGFDVIIPNIKSLFDDPTGKWVSPLFIPTMIANMAAGQVAIRFDARNACLSINTACATSSHSIGEAYRAIKHGYAKAMIAGGAEQAAVPLGLAGFANCKALTTAPDPKHACLPFNKDRAGFVMADGSGVLVLEEWDHAMERGARIYAEMVGYGSTCDAHHATAPRPDGTTQAKSISNALAEAGYDASSDIVYMNAHGTGTYLNDVTETRAIKLAFGEDNARKVHISSTKSMHGHMFGGTGAAEAIATIMALREGIVPPTINLDNPDPECDLDYTPNTPMEVPVNLGLSNSFGFGGHNACIAFRKISPPLP